MFISTEEQKEKYLILIGSASSNYDKMINLINDACKTYGVEFNGFTNGKITADYIKDLRIKTKQNIVAAEQATFISIIEKLKTLREEYIKECFPVTNTTDQLELDLIGKELAVMDPEELENFYKENILDTNKVRLFDIELKRRKNSNTDGLNAGLANLKALRDTYKIEDIITNTIDKKIKLIDGLRQFASDSVALVSNINASKNDDVTVKYLSLNNVIDYTEGKYRYSKSVPFDIREII